MKQQVSPAHSAGGRRLRGRDRDCSPASGRAVAMTAGPADIAGPGMINAQGTQDGGTGTSIELLDAIFHELHADGRHALCAVCG
jgi:hypothetical protein